MKKYSIHTISSQKELRQFIDLPWSIYEGDSNWVPPLKKKVATLLTPGKHPYWEFAKRKLFLLRCDGKPIGRIAAIVDHNYNKYHNENVGIWGFFECIEDKAAAEILFETSEEWLRNEGVDSIIGPFNPSTNYEVGVLVDGFNLPPVLMMTYNPAYYPALVESCGYKKEKDLFAFLFNRGHRLPEWVARLATRLVEKDEIAIRHLDTKNMKEEVRLINQIYRAAWADNWGFVPATDAEIDFQANELKDIIEAELAFFLYHKEEAVGMGVILPDVNPLLKEFNGKLGITALYKLFRHKSKIMGTRCILFGVKPKYHQMGVPLVALDYILKMSNSFEKYKYLEVGWTLEDNNGINDLLEDFGGKPYKRHRIYRKNL